MAVIFGVVLTLIGIGCAVEARSLFIGDREYGGGMDTVGFFLGVIAFLAFIGAIFLFIQAYRGGKGKK